MLHETFHGNGGLRVSYRGRLEVGFEPTFF